MQDVNMAMLSINNLTVGYGNRHLIENANSDFKQGTLVALIGRNGAGKSSLLRILAGIDRPIKGEVLIQGKDARSMNVVEKSKTISFVTTERVRIPNLKCKDMVGLGRAPYTNWLGNLSDSDRDIVHQSLKMVGMESYADRTMDKMSDGECQRIMIARALAQETSLILLDEPTSYLDLPNRYELCLLLRKLAHENDKCIIFSTHELDIALSLCDEIALIDTPRLLVDSPSDLIKSGAIQRLFTSPNMDFDPLTLRINPKNP